LGAFHSHARSICCYRSSGFVADPPRFEQPLVPSLPRRRLIAALAMVAAALALGLQDSRAQVMLPSSPAQTGNAPTKSTGKAPASSAAKTHVKPLWKDLSPTQREALTPLEPDWDAFPSDRKQKWLEVAAKYPRLRQLR